MISQVVSRTVNRDEVSQGACDPPPVAQVLIGVPIGLAHFFCELKLHPQVVGSLGCKHIVRNGVPVFLDGPGFCIEGFEGLLGRKPEIPQYGRHLLRQFGPAL